MSIIRIAHVPASVVFSYYALQHQELPSSKSVSLGTSPGPSSPESCNPASSPSFNFWKFPENSVSWPSPEDHVFWKPPNIANSGLFVSLKSCHLEALSNLHAPEAGYNLWLTVISSLSSLLTFLTGPLAIAQQVRRSTQRYDAGRLSTCKSPIKQLAKITSLLYWVTVKGPLE